MCGIYGYIGKNAVQKSICGLERLEYRGYDSAGIAYITENEKLRLLKMLEEFRGLRINLIKELNPILQLPTRAGQHTENLQF